MSGIELRISKHGVCKIKLEGVGKSEQSLKAAAQRLIAKWLWRFLLSFFFADQAISCLYPSRLNFQRDVTAISRRSSWRWEGEEEGCVWVFRDAKRIETLCSPTSKPLQLLVDDRFILCLRVFVRVSAQSSKLFVTASDPQLMCLQYATSSAPFFLIPLPSHRSPSLSFPISLSPFSLSSTFNLSFSSSRPLSPSLSVSNARTQTFQH